MPKVMRCRDLGMSCEFEARGRNEEEVLEKVAEHARKDHGMNTIPNEVAEKVKAAIHDE
jgi:predicted small metal-binding protein